MKRTIKLKESELKQMIAESVKRFLNESFMDDLKTGASYVKNKYKHNVLFKPTYPDRTIDACKQHIKWMEENLENKQKCGSRFLHEYKAYMEAAKEDGYIKYYNKMKELYDQMVEEGLYKNESDINGPSFDEIYTDLDNRVKSRGGYFHG